jgi:hypothetical protein
MHLDSGLFPLKLFFMPEKVKVKTGPDDTAQGICDKVPCRGHPAGDKGLVDFIGESVKGGKQDGHNSQLCPTEERQKANRGSL